MYQDKLVETGGKSKAEREVESGIPFHEAYWQEDLMRRVVNAITLSDDMKEQLSLDKYKMFKED